MPRKLEARAQALKMYVESKGKATHKAIAEAVGVTTWTVGQWSRAENWKKKIEEVKAPPVVIRRKKAETVQVAPAVPEPEKVETAEEAPAQKKRTSRADILSKEDSFDRAAKIFLQSGGSISNIELGRRVRVSAVTIANWKKMPQWSKAVVLASTEQVEASPFDVYLNPAETSPVVATTGPVELSPAAKRRKRAGGVVFRKKNSFARAVKIFQESGGKISNIALGKKVKVSGTTIANWKKMPQWGEAVVMVSQEPVEVSPAPKKRKGGGGPAIRKKDLFDQAARIFQESGGRIPNVELGRRVNVTDTTIAKWKKMSQWREAVAVEATEPVEVTPVVEEAPTPEVAPAEAASVPEIESAPAAAFDPESITALEDLVALNERLRGMLSRDFLTAAEIEHLSNAKLSLLEAAEVYLGIVKGSGE